MASTLELLMLARMLATPVGRAYATSAQSGITSTPVAVSMTATTFDNAGGFSASGVYTCPAAGTYRAFGKAKMANTAANWVQLYIYKNGAAYSVGATSPSTATGGGGVEADDLIQCNEGDTLTLYIASQASIATSISDGGSEDVFFDVNLVAWA